MKAARTLRTGLVALSLAGAGVLAGPVASSWAHAELISSAPADGATVAAVPPSADLTFTDEIDTRFVRTVVTTPAGTTTVQAATKGQTVAVPIRSDGPGPYRVVYRVVSADGHPISGQLRFTVAGTPTASASASVPASAGSVPGSGSSPGPSPAAASPAASAGGSGSAGSPGSAGGSGSANGAWLLWGAVGVAVAASGGAVAAALRGRRS